MKAERPLVSALMLTWNHERFVGEAIGSVLAQNAAFPIEIVIGADVSTDSTRDVVLEYARRRPDIIRPILPDRNVGMHCNFEAALRACSGKYVALLDGDDYWTHPDKLERQVAVLEQSPEHSICFHKVRMVSERTMNSPEYLPRSMAGQPSFERLLTENFIPTCSSMVRRSCIGEYPAWMYELGMADWPLHLMAAAKGSIAYIDEPMADYRIHAGGVWSARPASYQAEEQLKVLRRLRSHFGSEHAALIEQQILQARVNSAVAHAAEGNRERARMHALACIRSKPYRGNWYRKCAVVARTYAPAWAFRAMKSAQAVLEKTA